MNNEKKCDKYESLFVFQGDEALDEHLKECSECRIEHEKYKKISALVKEVAPVYLEQQRKTKLSAVKKLACCFVMFVGLTAFTGYKIYDENYIQTNVSDDSYITAIGLPADDYGLFEL